MTFIHNFLVMALQELIMRYEDLQHRDGNKLLVTYYSL